MITFRMTSTQSYMRRSSTVVGRRNGFWKSQTKLLWPKYGTIFRCSSLWAQPDSSAADDATAVQSGTTQRGLSSQVRLTLKIFLVIVLLAVVLWLSTLGVFVRRTVLHTLSVRTPLDLIEPASIDVRVHAVDSNYSTSGVPYLYYRTQDEPDYGITIIFNAKGDLVSEILLTQVVIGESAVINSPVALEPYSPPFR